MKLLCYEYKMFGPRAGVIVNDGIADITSLLDYPVVLKDVGAVINAYDNAVDVICGALAKNPQVMTLALDEVRLRAPLLCPPNIRDCAIFEKHVTRAGMNHGIGTPPSWYEKARFIFSNTGKIYGQDDEIRPPDNTTSLDFEAEVCMVIGKTGYSVAPEAAIDHIFGFTIFNDWSDRDLCNDEIGFIGLAKAKDFASGFGPWVVTMDEMAQYYRDGKLYLKVDAWINGEHFTDSSTDDMYWTIPYLIERISKDSSILAGDMIGLGTVGGGCIYEYPKEEQKYLNPGDVVEVRVEGIGTLRQSVGAVG